MKSGIVAGVKLTRLALVLPFALILGACGPNPQPKPSLIPVPSSAAPSAAAGVDLLIRLDVGNDERGVGKHTADYLSDGTVIRLAGGVMERNTLTATGLATLRARLAKDADLLGQAAVIKAQALPGKTISGGAIITDTLILARPNGARYTISFPAISSLTAGAWVSDPALDRLNALVADITDPVSVVGSAGLVNATWTAYQPASMAVFVTFSDVSTKFAEEKLAPDISATGWPFAGDPDTFGSAFVDANGTARRCAILPATDAMAAISRLKLVGSTLASKQLAAGGAWHSSTLLWAAKTPTTSLALIVVGLLPEDGAASCVDALAY